MKRFFLALIFMTLPIFANAREYLLSTQELDIYGTAKAYTGPVRLIHGSKDTICRSHAARGSLKLTLILCVTASAYLNEMLSILRCRVPEGV